MWAPRWSAVALTLLCLMALPASARAQTADEADADAGAKNDALRAPLEWAPGWGRAGIPNYLLIGSGAVVALVNLGIGPHEQSPTRGGWLFDEDVRLELRLGDEIARHMARDVSDIFLETLLTYPLLIDSVLVAGWAHDSPDVAFEMAMVQLEVVAVLMALHSAATIIVSRERPYGRTCGGPGADDLPGGYGPCTGSDRYKSFFSGHSSMTFANAAVLCSYHMNLPLYGGGAADTAACLAGIAFAGTTALLRVAGDMHYATDVLTGAVVGTTLGFLLPWLLHFGHGAERAPASAEGLRWMLAPTPNGASMVGVF